MAQHNSQIEPTFVFNCGGNIPHSQASIEKARQWLGYKPVYEASKGFEKACEWYFIKL